MLEDICFTLLQSLPVAIAIVAHGLIVGSKNKD